MLSEVSLIRTDPHTHTDICLMRTSFVLVVLQLLHFVIIAGGTRHKTLNSGAYKTPSFPTSNKYAQHERMLMKDLGVNENCNDNARYNVQWHSSNRLLNQKLELSQIMGCLQTIDEQKGNAKPRK